MKKLTHISIVIMLGHIEATTYTAIDHQEVMNNKQTDYVHRIDHFRSVLGEVS